LTRLQFVSGDHDQDVLGKRLEDMGADELAFADAYAERQIARATKRMAGLRRVSSAPAEDNEGRGEEGAMSTRRDGE
jgi:hypothetical protein